jgi:hypothetical protein
MMNGKINLILRLCNLGLPVPKHIDGYNPEVLRKDIDLIVETTMISKGWVQKHD